MQQYLDLVEHVLGNGSFKENRTGVHTITSFSRHYEIDLQEGYPLLTTKDMEGPRWNSMLHELCWYLSGEEHIRNLREETKIWDAWADADGHLDTAYGRFWRRFPVPSADAHLPGESWAEKSDRWINREDGSRKTFDQIQYIVDTLTESPESRRLVLTAWHPANATVSTLPPCHFTVVFNVQDGRLNTHLTQRSGDIALGIPFNIAAYSLLTMLIAQEVDLVAGRFAHTIVDAHVYCGRDDRGTWYRSQLDALQRRVRSTSTKRDFREIADWIETNAPPEADGDRKLDHVPGLLRQCSRTPYERPSLRLDSVSIDEFTPDHVELIDYRSHDGISFAVAE